MLSAVSGRRLEEASRLSAASPAPAALHLEPDSLVQSIVNSVSQDSIRATILRLQEFGTRACTTDSNYAAVLYAQDRMVSYACDTVYLHRFDTTGYFRPSVIGLKRGRLYPDMEYIICGHIDSDGFNTHDTAPGADDNASGTSVVLEAYRVFAQHWFNYTVRFICFNAEEAGLRGSGWYAWEARLRGDSILGVLNFDMVGYGMEGRDSVFVAGQDSGPNCADLLQQWCFAANAYTALKCRPFLCDRDSLPDSDHYEFWVNGYRALLIHGVQYPPQFHSPADTLGPFGYESCGVNNLPLCTEATKATVAALAVLAQVEGIPGVEEPRQSPLPAFRPASAFTRGLPAGAVVFDAMGRRVVSPRSGVYFIREAQAKTVRKVIITE
jgi:hypothetical protein